ncbi:MAG: hypothetical protein IPG63_11395 [Xanthomonadales bacterium]|jgi:hypothetical protein|nr:hypothetical protein [Xanthomonadales bacterium]MBK7145659.1 hypothetical protein [Xanthomonadales bacterium]MCC6561512.1 hypothetical protein [Xanthomonadales bacterium]
MSSPNVRWLPLIPALVFFSGCGLFGRGGLHEAYLDAENGKTLQVPNALDAPDRRQSMMVPDAAGEAGSVSEAPLAGLPLDADDPQSRLKMRMPPDAAFAKVVEALTQAKIAKLGEVDATEHRITLGFDVTEERKRWWWKDGTRVNTILRVAHVVDDPVGARVIIEEEDDGLRIDDEYAQRVLSALRDRIQWE